MVVQAKHKETGDLVAIKHLKVDPENKHKLVYLYRELSIIEFLSGAMKKQHLPRLFTECLEVLCPDEEV